MNKNNKHLPYPFLSSNTDDYGNTKFTLEIQTEENDEGWKLDISINLEDEDLKNKVAKEIAFYHFVINCKSTGYRKIIKSHETSKKLQIDIAKDDIKNKITIECFIIANQDFPLTSRGFNNDYKGRSFDVKKIEVLAETELLELEEPEVADPLEPIKSFVKIQKQPINNQHSYAYTGLQGDNIVIYLNEKDFKNYNTLKGKDENSVLMSMLLIPSLMQAIDGIIKDTPEYENLKWRRILEEKIDKIDRKYKELHNEDWDTFEVAQKILGNQISIAMQQRIDYLSGDE